MIKAKLSVEYGKLTDHNCALYAENLQTNMIILYHILHAATNPCGYLSCSDVNCSAHDPTFGRDDLLSTCWEKPTISLFTSRDSQSQLMNDTLELWQAVKNLRV